MNSSETIPSTRNMVPVYRNDPHVCIKCQQPRAHWSVRHPSYGSEAQPLCALCFFNTSGWLEPNRAQFNLVVNALGLRRNRALERNAAGQLVLPKDADDVLGAIVLHDRVDAVQHLKQHLFRRSAE